jgi:hypothetical protein
MDRTKYQLLEQLEQLCSQRLDGYWELLATAAGNQESVQQSLRGLETEDLKWGTPIVREPAMAGERVLALSVSNLNKVRQLYAEWQRMRENQEIDRHDAWLLNAWSQAERCLATEHYDAQAPSWSWREEFNLFPDNGRILSRRPLRESYLTAQDIYDALEQGAGILRALRTQTVKVEKAVFYHYANHIDSIDPYILALMIELSRKTNFDQGIWIKAFLKKIPQMEDALYLTPSVYCLLNPEWCVP